MGNLISDTVWTTIMPNKEWALWEEKNGGTRKMLARLMLIAFRGGDNTLPNTYKLWFDNRSVTFHAKPLHEDTLHLHAEAIIVYHIQGEISRYNAMLKLFDKTAVRYAEEQTEHLDANKEIDEDYEWIKPDLNANTWYLKIKDEENRRPVAKLETEKLMVPENVHVLKAIRENGDEKYIRVVTAADFKTALVLAYGLYNTYADSAAIMATLKQRQAAQKRYLTYTAKYPNPAAKLNDDYLKYAMVAYNGGVKRAFTNCYSLIVTNDEIYPGCETGATTRDAWFDKFEKQTFADNDKYKKERYDIRGALDECKSQGYKLTFSSYKPSANSGKTFYIEIEEQAYAAAMLELCFSVIDDGGDYTVRVKDGTKGIVIETKTGMASVLPIRMVIGDPKNEHVITAEKL